MNKYEKNILLYKIYTIFAEPLFWGPVLIQYLQNIGHMSLSEIYMMEASVVLFLVVLEPLTGVLADHIGRKKATVLGSVTLFVCYVFFAMIDTRIDAWASNIVWVIGFSLTSGAKDAILTDSLKGSHYEQKERYIRAQSMAFRLLLVALCSLSAGYMYAIHPRLPMLLSIPGVGIMAVTSMFFWENSPIYSSQSSYGEKMEEAWNFLQVRPYLWWIIAFAIMISGTMKVWFFAYNTYFELIELPIEMYGLVFSLLHLTSWFSGRYIARTIYTYPEKIIFLSVMSMLGIALFFFGQLSSIGGLFMLLIPALIRGFFEPFMYHVFNRYVDGHIRASLNSFWSAIDGLCDFALLQGFGILIEIIPLSVACVVLSIFVGISGILLMLLYPKQLHTH